MSFSPSLMSLLRYFRRGGAQRATDEIDDAREEEVRLVNICDWLIEEGFKPCCDFELQAFEDTLCGGSVLCGECGKSLDQESLQRIKRDRAAVRFNRAFGDLFVRHGETKSPVEGAAKELKNRLEAWKRKRLAEARGQHKEPVSIGIGERTTVPRASGARRAPPPHNPPQSPPEPRSVTTRVHMPIGRLFSRILDWLLGPDESWVCRHCGGDITISGAPGREIRVCADCGRAADEVRE